MKKMRLFSLRQGLELMDSDHMESVHGHKYLFYSFGKFYWLFSRKCVIYLIPVNLIGEDFDHQVRMEFIEMKRKLGEGGFGSVFLAHDRLLDQEVAIKILNFQCSKTSHMITKEIEALGSLRHKNIVKLYDYFPLPKK